jgi:hypothetical protein
MPIEMHEIENFAHYLAHGLLAPDDPPNKPAVEARLAELIRQSLSLLAQEHGGRLTRTVLRGWAADLGRTWRTLQEKRDPSLPLLN